MVELPLIAAAGLLGSAHCLGMCGPFALLIAGGARGAGDAAYRQITFSLGRVTTYAFLGAVAGFGGAWLAHYRIGLVRASAILALIAGTVLVVQGLSSLGVWRRAGRSASAPSHVLCLAASGYRHLLKAPGLGPVLFAGTLTGFLPCGLLYGMIALAATTHSVLRGALVMVVFGTGTIPALWIFGWSSGSLSAVWRARVWRVAACAVLLTGLVTIGRGMTALAASRSSNPEQVCPLCHPSGGAGDDRSDGSFRTDDREDGRSQSDPHDHQNADQ